MPPRARRVLRRAALLIFLLAAGPGLSDLFAIDGQVIELDGRPVADASVSILGQPGAARTDAAGRFVFQPDPVPPFRVLVIRADGRPAPPLLVSSLEPGSPLVLTLEALQGEQVTVTAGAAPHTEAPPGAAVSLMAREDLQRRHPARLADALENVPGAGRLGQGHDAVPSLRGLARGRTLLLLDGGRIATERRAGPSGGFLDPFFLETIEVSRGPGAAAYGSDAFGGVIQARTRQAERGSPLGIRFAGSLGTGIPERDAGVEISRGLSEGGLLLQARGRYFGDYDTPDGTLEGSSASDSGVLGRFDHEAGAGNLSVGWLSSMGRDVERATDPASTLSVSQPHDDAHRLTLAYDMDPLAGGTLLSFTGFAARSRQLTRQEIDQGAGLPADVSTSDVRATDYGARARVVRPAGRGRLEGGLDLNGRFDLSAEGEVSSIPESSIDDASRSDAALYLSGEAPLSRRISVSAGARFDRIAARNSGGFYGDHSADDTALSGHGSLTIGPFSGLSLTLQASRGFRDPSLSDRYFVGVSGRGFVTGNPDLEPEESLQFDAALRWTATRVQGALYGYSYRIDDVIERFEMGQDAAGRDLFFFRNRGHARLFGIEAEARIDLPASVTLEVSAQAARGEDDADEPIDDIPAESLTVLASRPLGTRASGWLRVAAFDRDDDAGPSERIVPGYALLDAGGGLQLGESASLRLTVRNLLDRTYLASPDRRTPYAPGISALLSFTLNLRG